MTKMNNISKKVNIIQKNGGRVKIGIGTYFNSGTVRADWANITIGNYCRISYDVLFLTNYGSHLLMTDDKKIRNRDIVVGDNVWIGWGSKIRGGVTIGDFALTGMGSVIIKDIEPFHMAGGNPAKDLGLRPDTEKIISLIKKKCGKAEGTPFEIITKFKKQGYIFAEVGGNRPEAGSTFFVIPPGKKIRSGFGSPGKQYIVK
jgi:acetyltransferase-like isoleucine patch superfamily enzyme